MFNIYLSFCVFAFVAAVTPGPTNLLAFSNGNQFGVKATLPFVIGSSASAAGILLLTTSGISEFLMQWVWLQQLFAWAGTLWLSWMAFALYNAPVHTIGTDATSGTSLTFGKGMGLQLVNPKTWITAITVSTVFTFHTNTSISYQLHSSLLASIIFIISCPCLSFWAVLGKATTRHIHSPHKQQLLNKALALLLGLIIWWAQITATLDLVSAKRLNLF